MQLYLDPYIFKAPVLVFICKNEKQSRALTCWHALDHNDIKHYMNINAVLNLIDNIMQRIDAIDRV
ncbi:hypothetical protein BTV98_06605 [Psychrobacter sp. Cmf 22.2]|nr:hypothetical protein BTV98_06605 [Psychrobacter sp. Cmf 22.2]